MINITTKDSEECAGRIIERKKHIEEMEQKNKKEKEINVMIFVIWFSLAAHKKENYNK